MSELWNRLDPGFLAPIWLIVGFFAVIAVLLLEIGARRRRKQALRLFAASHLIQALTSSISQSKRILKQILLVAAVGFLFIALARPHLFFDWSEENRSGLDLLLAVDCSKSMLTEDVKPNRIERAKLAIADFADRLPDNRLGLIAFAGDAFLQCPLTLDHNAFQSAVNELDTDTIPRPGTDIATAIDQAVLALKSQPNNMKFLILVTDGEDLEGRVFDAARAAAQSGLKIYTVGVGTPSGGLIPERDDSGSIMYLHDNTGQIVQSKLDENSLRQIASITGGAYVQLGQRGEGLEEVYNQYIATLPKQHLEERREKIRLERFEWPLALSILFLVWEFMTNERAAAPASATPAAVSRPLRRRPKKNTAAAVTLPALMVLLMGMAGSIQAASTDTAEKAYKSGNYDDAFQNYRKAAETQPDRNELQYDLGAAAYKSGVYTEAEEAFRKSLDTSDLNLQENAYYNLGNSQFRHGEQMQQADTKRTIDLWERALNSYESALKIHKSTDTQHNYDVVKKKLDELKQQQKQQQQQQQQNQSQPKKDQSGQSSPQNQDKGQDQNQPQNQQGQNSPQNGNGQNQPQPSPPPGDQSQQQTPPGSQDQGKDGQQPQSSNQNNSPQRGRSQSREQDQQDPSVKSRQQAEDLLDSLKDDERHVSARALNGDNQVPPTNSGKDW